MKSLFLLLALFLSPSLSMAESKPPEIGEVAWRRDFDAALKESKSSGKPVFAFFQEVPGCAGCQQFGKTVLSDPLLVEAIETEFVPVLIFNNRPGKDFEILKRYGEPQWNYQVIRFLDGEGGDLIPRKDKVWTIGPLAERMIATLDAAKRPVPKYLRALADEHRTDRHARTAFQMSCFWTGELKLGGLEGVVATEAGWFGGREVTLVTWNRDQTDLKALVKAAEKARCAERVFVSTDDELKAVDGKTRLRAGKLDQSYRIAPPADQKKQLQGTAFAKLKLSPMQATKVNALARVDPEAAMEWLTPRQRAEVEN